MTVEWNQSTMLWAYALPCLLFFSVQTDMAADQTQAGESAVAKDTSSLTRNTYSIKLSLSQQASYDFIRGNLGLLDFKLDVQQSTSLHLRTFDLSTQNRCTVELNSQSTDSTAFSEIQAGDSQLFVSLRCAYAAGWLVDPYVSASMSTPLLAQHANSPSIERIGSIFDPLTTAQNCGVQYRSVSERARWMLQASASMQQIQSHHSSRLTDNLLTPDVIEHYKALAGLECGMNAELTLDSSTSYSAQYLSRKNILQNSSWQIQCTNELKIRLRKSLGLTLNLVLNYDDTQTKRLQFKQSTYLSLQLEF